MKADFMAMTRRDMLDASLAALGAAALPGAAAALAKAAPGPADSAPLRERIDLDFDWRFHLGHAQDPARDFGFGADQAAYAKAGPSKFAPAPTALDYADADWEPVQTPHDWGAALPFVAPALPAPAGADDPLAAHGYKPLGREFPETSVGWYRRRLDVPAADLGRRLWLSFDGVFRDAVVFVNGYIVHENHSGYAPFDIDVTDFVNYGAGNTIVVRVDASQGEGWFYEGAGIYRHVWLTKLAAVHVPLHGVFVRSEVRDRSAALTLSTEVRNQGAAPTQAEVSAVVVDGEGRVVATADPTPVSVQAGATLLWEQRVTIAEPRLWSIEAPHLYSLVTEIRVDGRTADRVVTPFGVRTLRFDAEHGFFLNDKAVKLQGTCNHQDHAGVGVALPDALNVFRIRKLQAMGCNAWRAAHNPPSAAFLDACDRLGMLVVDETRRMSSDPEAMDELTRMVRRDRNHPSVILWSIGNEEPQQSTARGARIARVMKDRIRALDGTRLVTAAMDNGWTEPEGLVSVLDVVGFNYRTPQIDDFHRRFPSLPVIGTETGSTVTTRGVYRRDPVRQYTTAYDEEAPWWASTAEAWQTLVAERPYIAGGFIWTGFDYRGEPTPFGRWPSIGSYFGVLDTCGFEKDAFFYYQAAWTAAPVLHILPHWNWGAEGEPIRVWCYTNVDEVELSLNGRPIGRAAVTPGRHLEWTVPYAPGVLTARGYRAGRLVASAKRETAGPAAAIRLTADRTRLSSDGQDVAVVMAEIVDAQGRLVPTADHPVTFAATGPASVIGVGNGDPTSHEADKAVSRKAFNGLCQSLVQAQRRAGPIRLSAASPGLKPALLSVTAA